MANKIKNNMDNHIFFWKPQNNYGIFSNWWKDPKKKSGPQFTDNDGNKYCCTEQYMMYKKALLFGDDNSAKCILDTTDPREMKDLGRKVTGFDEKEWNNSREQIMIDGLMYKFSQNKNLYTFILSTGDKILVEASPYDKIWGVGMDEATIKKTGSFNGENLLGKCLMKVRADLRKLDEDEEKETRN